MFKCVFILDHSGKHLPSSAVTNYLIKFHCIKATFINLVQSQTHCSPANEIKATFAFLPAFNYISGRTAWAQRLNEGRGEIREKLGLQCRKNIFFFPNYLIGDKICCDTKLNSVHIIIKV